MGIAQTKSNRTKQGANILTRQHPGWTEFADHLHDDLMINGCSGQPDQAVRLLGNIQGVDVEKTLDYFRYNGACCCCGCEIMLNIDAG